MKPKVLIAAATSALAASLVAGGLFMLRDGGVPTASTGVGTPVASASEVIPKLKVCSNLPAAEIGVCQIRVLEESALPVVDAISVLTQSSSTMDCHTAAHELGKRMWTESGSLIPAGTELDTCNYGVIHGAMAGAALDISIDELLEKVSVACETAGGPCWHGVGHALTEVIDTPAEVMATCQTTEQSQMCISGAAMEYALRTPGTTYGICDSLKDNELFECDLQVSLAFGGVADLSQEYFAQCIELGRKGCVLGAGWAIYMYGDRDVTTPSPLCKVFGDDELICVGGVLMQKAYLEQLPGGMNDLCTQLYSTTYCIRMLDKMSTMKY